MLKRLTRKDYFLRKQYNKFEIWNTLNKSLKKSFDLYNIPKNTNIKKKKNIAKHLYITTVLKPVEVEVLFLFFVYHVCWYVKKQVLVY